jgi:hypothetical protein
MQSYCTVVGELWEGSEAGLAWVDASNSTNYVGYLNALKTIHPLSPRTFTRESERGERGEREGKGKGKWNTFQNDASKYKKNVLVSLYTS